MSEILVQADFCTGCECYGVMSCVFCVCVCLLSHNLSVLFVSIAKSDEHLLTVESSGAVQYLTIEVWMW